VDLEIPDAQHLRFRFPDTDAVVRAASDGATLAGRPPWR